MKYLALIVIVGLIIVSCKDPWKTPKTDPEPESAQAEKAEVEPIPTPTDPAVDFEIMYYENGEVVDGFSVEGETVAIDEPKVKESIWKKILMAPIRILKWPVVKIKSWVMVDGEPKYKFTYHYYCDERPDNFSGICVNKVPNARRYLK